MSQVAFAVAAGVAFMLGGLAMFMLMLAPLPTVPTPAPGLEVLLAFTGAAVPAAPVSACVLLLAEVIAAVAIPPRPADITP